MAEHGYHPVGKAGEPGLGGPGLLAIVPARWPEPGCSCSWRPCAGSRPAAAGPAARRRAHETGPSRAAAAALAGLVVLVLTRWLVAGVGAALLVLSWRGLSGVAGERAAMARLEALATWTESLRDTIAGAVGLEQAIPASLRAAAPSLRDPLAPWWSGCTPGCPCPRRCAGSPTTSPIPAPT